MTIWPPSRDKLTRPAYLSLARSLAQAVESGSVRPGTRLPTHRALAFELGLSVQTISRAYQELARLGVISGEVGRGSFVLPPKTDARLPWQRGMRDEEVLDCSMLTPVPSEIHVTRMADTLAEMSKTLSPNVLFSFRPRQALSDHAAQAHDWLRRCGLSLDDPARILPTNGNTAAMTCALMTAASPGDLVLADNMTHHTLISLAASLGMRLEGAAADEEGLLPDVLDQICATRPVKVLFLMPAGLGPTASYMSIGRREALVSVARKHDVSIIENDAWGPLEPGRPPPLAVLAPERTFYMTGLTKCLLPGLRIGWLVAPEVKAYAARTRHLVTNWVATPLMAEIASRWIGDGTAEELLAAQREALARRNQIAARVLRGLSFRASPFGLHIWLPLPVAWDEGAFVSLARYDGIAVSAGALFAIDSARAEPGVRVSLGAGSEADLEEGLSVLVRLIRTAPEPSAPVF